MRVRLAGGPIEPGEGRLETLLPSVAPARDPGGGSSSGSSSRPAWRIDRISERRRSAIVRRRSFPSPHRTARPMGRLRRSRLPTFPRAWPSRPRASSSPAVCLSTATGGGGEREDLRDVRPGDRGESRSRRPRRGRGHRAAVAAARRAFDDERSDWRRMTPSERGKLIHRIGDLIEQTPTSWPARDARQRQAAGHRARRRRALAADLFRYMAGWATKIEGNTIPISAATSPGRSSSPTRCASRSASSGRSSRGTSRC